MIQKSKILITAIALVLCLSASAVAFAQVSPDDPPFPGGTKTSVPQNTSNGGGWTWQPLPGGSKSGSSSSSSSSSGSGSSSGYCKSFSGGITLQGTTLTGIIYFITCFLSRAIVPFIFAVALVVFIWGVFRFMLSPSSEEREEGRKFMLWGIIALAVMMSVWGLVAVLGGTFGVKSVVPQIPVNQK
jgi:hypothetical protein